MCRTPIIVLLLSTLLGADTPAAGATQPAFFNAQIHPLGAPDPDLESAFAALLERDAGPAWAAYTVPMVGGRRNLCCGSSRCSLEPSGGHFVDRDDGGDAQRLRVLLRFDDRRPTEIRALSSGCELDAGGLPVYVWEGIETRRSLEFLLARADTGREQVAEGALMAIAHHAGAGADRLLERIARGEEVPRLDEEAVFWLGEARGAGGFDVLERLRRELEETSLLEQVAFALHLSEAPGALPALIDMARRDPRGDVRGSALFWLSQQAGERATAAIVEAGEEDPDVEVKERAIFALSQLPPDRGVPLLIRYARTHDSREIRKKAMFWLGQTEDPRALAFFEEILSSP